MNTDQPASYGASTVEEIHLDILSGDIDKVTEYKKTAQKIHFIPAKEYKFSSHAFEKRMRKSVKEGYSLLLSIPKFSFKVVLEIKFLSYSRGLSVKLLA